MAFVPHRDTRNGRDRDGIVAITVTSIEEGDQDLFHRSVENSEGLEAYYIRSTVENVSREDLGTAVFSIDLVQSDGSPMGFVMFGGDIRNPGFGDCRGQNLPTYAELGTVIETCDIGGVRSGQVAGGARTDQPIPRISTTPSSGGNDEPLSRLQRPEPASATDDDPGAAAHREAAW